MNRWVDQHSNFGVAITTHMRPDLFTRCLQHINEHSPPDMPLVVVDDGNVPEIIRKVPADYGCEVVRHPLALGIPAAKNAGIAALMDAGVDHLFLFDDDVWPIKWEWWKPYVEGPEPHYQYCWQKFATTGNPLPLMQEVYRDPDLIGYGHSMGCMLYLAREVVDRVGGFDLRFGLGVEEHIEYSQRVHNANLTTFVGQDVQGSAELFYASDEHLAAISSIDKQARNRQVAQNRALRLSLTESDQFMPYRHPRDVVLTFYSNNRPDILEGREGQVWADGEQGVARLQPLIESVGRMSGRPVVLHDCLPPNLLEPVENHLVHTPESPYNQRWIAKYQYLRAHPDIRFGWLVDSTDVTMLHDPFDDMQVGALYCGWEGTVVGHHWVRSHSQSVPEWVQEHQNEMLLNCGVVGGDRATLMSVCRRMIDMWAKHKGDPLQETVWFNMIARRHTNLVTGPKVTTVFKQHNTGDPHAWWCHK